MHQRSDLSPEQIEHVERIVSGAENFVILPVGFGKTIVTLTAIADLREIYGSWRTLVISTKNIVELTWGQEIAEWEHTRHLTYAAATGRLLERRALSAPDILGVNFESLERYYDLVDAGKVELPEILVIDESDGMKSHNAKRVVRHCGFGRSAEIKKTALFPDRVAALKAVPGYVHKFKLRVALSATPTAEGYAEIWAQECSISRKRRLGVNITSFRSEYCSARPGGPAGAIVYEVGKAAQERIHDKLADILSTARSDKYLKLPDPEHLQATIRWQAAELQRYKDFEKTKLIELEQLEGQGVKSLIAPQVGVLINKLRQMCSGFLYETQPEQGRQTHWFPSAEDKLRMLGQIVDASLDEPLLVFTQYEAERELIAKRFPFAQIGLPPSLDAWSRREIQMMVLHPKSGGHGLNLQHGSHVAVWFALPWPYRQWHQANGRLHRTGQTEQVQIIRFVREKSVELDVWAKLQGKSKTLADFIQGIRERQR